MLPGFAGYPIDKIQEYEQLVTTAGWDWATGGGNACKEDHTCKHTLTTTQCIFFTMWCTDHCICAGGVIKNSGAYICGACGNPFDWGVW